MIALRPECTRRLGLGSCHLLCRQRSILSAMERSVHRKKAPPGPRPLMLWADGEGRIYEQPGWGAAGRRGHEILPLDPADLIPLPEGSELFLLPGRAPLGFRSAVGPRVFAGGGEAQAVAAFLPPAYTQYHLPAWSRRPGAPVLPLYAYTAVAFHEGGFAVPAV